jgi:hypothetical protein
MTSITIPNSVTNIGDYAFCDCTSLSSVTIGTNITSIGDWAFDNCTNLTSVTIPNGVTNIGYGMFSECSSLTNVTIPNSVTNIGDYAFCDCTSLSSVTIGTNITSIGDWAFDNCTNLTSITIPNSVTSIGGYAFQYCTNLTGVYFEGNAPTNVGSDVFSGVNNLTVYYVAGTTGWSSTFAGFPAVEVNESNPTLAITAPFSGQNWSNGTFNVTGTASDNLQVSAVWFQVNSNGWQLAATTNNWTNWTATASLIPGTNVLQVYAVNPFGFNSTNAPVNLNYVAIKELQVHIAGVGTLSPNYSNTVLQAGQTYKMTATAGNGFVFTNWTVSTNWLGGMITNNATVQFTMAWNLTLTANFIYTPDSAYYFTNTGSLNNARYSHTATLLPNGQVLVAGGGDCGRLLFYHWTSTIPISNAELYLPLSGTWTNTGSMNNARLDHTATLLANGQVLVAGGVDSYGYSLFSAELYNPTTGTWTNTGSLNNARLDHTATLLANGQVLVAGGLDSDGYSLFSAELYNPATGTWTNTGSLNNARARHTATLLTNGLVLVAGGDDAGNSAELYNPATGTWTNTGSMNNAHSCQTATLLTNGQVLVAGGLDHIDYTDYSLSSAELYNPTTGTWTNTGSLNVARYGHTATLLFNGQVLVAGGCFPNNMMLGEVSFTNSAELYLPAAGIWINTSSMTNARYAHTATLLPNLRVLVAGGAVPGGRVPGIAPCAISSAELQINFVDTNKPVLNITNVVSGMQVSNANYIVKGMATDNVAVASVYCQLNGTGWANSTNLNGCKWTDQVTLIPGTNQFQAYAMDTSGNISVTNTVNIVYVESAQLTVTTNGVGSLSPNNNGALLQIGRNYSINAKTVWGSGFAFTNWTGGTSLPLSPITNGPTVQFVMVSNLMLQANFVDTQKPTVSITNLASGQRVSNAGFTVKGKASDNWQVSNVVCQINGGGWNLATNINNWTNWAAGVTLIPGTNVVQAYAVDTTGNVSTTNSVSFDFVVTNQLQIHASGLGTISPNYSNAWLEIGRNYSITSTPASGFVFSNWVTSTNWIGGTTTTKTNLSLMMASNLTLQACFMETSRPTLSITAPTSGQHMTNALATVIGTAKDNWKVTGVWYRLNNGTWNLTPTANDWTNWTSTLQLTTGTNTVKVYALDLGGNYSTTSSVSVLSSNTFKLRFNFDLNQPLTSTGLNFTLQISSNLNGHIQVSTNMLNWVTLTNFVGTNTTHNFRDPAATNSPRRFYRAVIP